MCKSDYGGGGGKNVPKIDYVIICERPLTVEINGINDNLLSCSRVNEKRMLD